MQRSKMIYRHALLLLAVILSAGLCFTATASADSCSVSGTFTITGTIITSNTSCTGAITIPTNVTEIGTGAFNGATGLTSVTFATPSSATGIGSNAFKDATSLTSITIPDSVTSIGSNTFWGATSLVSVTLPSGLTTTSLRMFKGDTALTSITIPSSVTVIGYESFWGSGLTRLTIPSGVTMISDQAFREMTALTRIEFLGNQPACQSVVPGGGCGSVFVDSNNATVYRFAAATGWPSIGSTYFGRPQTYLVLAPPAPTAVAGNASATITVAAASVGPTPDTYTVAAVNDPSKTCTVTSPATDCTVNGLTNGTSYTFTAVANTTSPASSLASTASNAVTPITAASAPTSLLATANNESIDIAFTAGANGGSAITNYEYRLNNTGTWTAFSPAQTTSPVTITGLTNGTPYTVELRAITSHNTAGTASTPTSSVTPQPPAPNTPDTPAAIAGNAQATITVTAGTGPGGTAETYLVIAVEDATKTCTITVPTTSCTITGLTNGTSYTFTTSATNAGGTSAASTASNAVTPTAPANISPTPPVTSAVATTSPAVLRLTSTRPSATGNAITTTFMAPGPGDVHLAGTVSTSRRGTRAAALTVCTSAKTIHAAGVTRVICNLNNTGRRLRTQQALVITLTTVFTPTSGTPMTSTNTVRLARTHTATTPPATSTTPSTVTG